MHINDDFRQRVVINTTTMAWIPSPMADVERKMLDRMGAESGHATSIVRYASNSHFPAHTHTGGEEFLVLNGIFSDEHGDYPIGTYVRNPIGSNHTPFSTDGCTIFVKLWQFDIKDTGQLVLQTDRGRWEKRGDGIERQFLHQHGDECVQLLKLQANAEYSIDDETEGTELLLLEGRINESDEEFDTGTWIRNPVGYGTSIKALSKTLIYLKTGHL